MIAQGGVRRDGRNPGSGVSKTRHLSAEGPMRSDAEP